MNNILDRLVDSTRRRIAKERAELPLEQLRETAAPPPRPFAFEKALREGGVSFICEVKKASPSKGVIAEDFPYLQIAREYRDAGAAAISVLTEPEFFQGSGRYLREIRGAVDTPLLRKDFVVDEYMIYQARSLGADAVLLICACLSPEELGRFHALAEGLGMSCLVEVHDEAEVRMALEAGARIIGVNNRDLRTFQVSLETTLRLRELAPPEAAFVSESGIRSALDVDVLRRHGVDAVLVGEALMRSPDKAAALRALRGDAT